MVAQHNFEDTSVDTQELNSEYETSQSCCKSSTPNTNVDRGNTSKLQQLFNEVSVLYQGLRIDSGIEHNENNVLCKVDRPISMYN